MKKKKDLIATLIGQPRGEAHQFVQRVNRALPERASFSAIARVLRDLPPKKRTVREVITVLERRPRPRSASSVLSRQRART